MNKKTGEIVDCYDELTRYLSQTKSLASALLCEDHSTIISNAMLCNLIWLISDRLEDIEKAANALYESSSATSATVHDLAHSKK